MAPLPTAQFSFLPWEALPFHFLYCSLGKPLSLALSEYKWTGESPRPRERVFSYPMWCSPINKEDGSLFPPNIICIIMCLIYTWNHGYLFYSLGYNLILCYLFCGSAGSSVGFWNPFWLTLGLFAMLPSYCLLSPTLPPGTTSAQGSSRMFLASILESDKFSKKP